MDMVESEGRGEDGKEGKRGETEKDERVRGKGEVHADADDSD